MRSPAGARPASAPRARTSTDLVDAGSFVEYAPLVVAAQRRRRSLQELIERTPADGLVGGVGTVDGQPTIAMSYDYTVLAGTQGLFNHAKKDRLFELAEQLRGCRSCSSPKAAAAGRATPTAPACRASTASRSTCSRRLSGLVPLVGITSGYCFAGNAALLGCCDVIIATEGSNIGMGGPAMIEGGGLGVYEPKAIGPTEVQNANGVIDVLVPDEAEAVRVAKQYLVVLPRARSTTGSASISARCVISIPENRLRAYDVRTVVDALCDTGSVLELRRGFALGHDHRVGARSKAGRSASSPTTRRTSAARSTRRGPTRPRASCSCATRSTCRCSSSATRRASWSARSRRRRRRCGTCRACS